MNQILLKNKPKELTDVEFKALWARSSYVLETLARLVTELAPQPKIVKEDFLKPAFEYNLVYDQAKFDLAQKILENLPKIS